MVGPLLFTAYINQLATTDSEQSMRILFADDMLLLAPRNNIDDHNSIQQSIDDIRSKTGDLKMKLNGLKCCCITMSEGRLPFVPDTPLNTGGTELGALPNFHTWVCCLTKS